jgi:nitrate/nitrite-specific signal transduction histidine kinase
MKIKVILSLFLIFLSFIVGSTLAILSIADITEELNHVIKLHQVEQLRRALVISIQNVQSNLYTVHTPLSQNLDFIVNNVIDLEKSSKKCSTCHHVPLIKKRIVKVQSLLKDYETLLSFYITVSANLERKEELKRQAAIKGNVILAEVANMSHNATRKLEELTIASSGTINNIKKTLLVTIGFSILIGVMIAFKLTRSVTQPVKKLLEATRMISSGQLGSTVSYNEKAEFGELADNFNTMSIKLKEQNEKLRARSEELEKNSKELEKRIKELEDFYNISIGRELRMKELKAKIKTLELYIEKLESELLKYNK